MKKSETKKCCAGTVFCVFKLLGDAGLFLAGCGAFLAALQANPLLEKILEIRSISKNIEISVQQLGGFFKKQYSLATVEQTKNLNREQINKIINEIPSETSSIRAGDIYLPSHLRAQVFEGLSSDKSPQEKSLLLQKNLQIKDVESYNIK